MKKRKNQAPSLQAMKKDTKKRAKTKQSNRICLKKERALQEPMYAP